MKKFVTAVIISFIITVSTAGIDAAAFSSSNVGAAFVVSNVLDDEDSNVHSGVTVIDGSKENIKFTFKIAELIKSWFD